MEEISFKYLEKQSFSSYAPKLFLILFENMSVIAPTGNSFDEDYELWSNSFGKAFSENVNRKIIIIKNSKDDVIGFFGYSTTDDTFRMEEIQFSKEYQGKNDIFRKLYHFLIENLPSDLKFAEAYANKRNEKSTAILGKLGLKIIGTNKTETCYHFKGNFEDLLKWLNHKK